MWRQNVTEYARQSQSAFCGRKTETQFERQKNCQHPCMALDEVEEKNHIFFIQEPTAHFALFKKMFILLCSRK
jgi:hypothetical protein